MFGNTRGIASQIIQKTVKRVNSEEDLKIGEVFTVLHKKLKKGRVVSFNSELIYKKNKIGLIYQEAIKTHRKCSTYELSTAMPKHMRELFIDLKEREIKHIIIISNMQSSNFDGVSFGGLEIFIKLAYSKQPNLLGSITILPKVITISAMYKLYSAIVPKIDGAKDVEGSIELVKKLASKLA
jgi:hypothetical protein